ncbi:hypothetical protein JCM10213v2_002583 [Rhodosporidiobolus nylandii]
MSRPFAGASRPAVPASPPPSAGPASSAGRRRGGDIGGDSPPEDKTARKKAHRVIQRLTQEGSILMTSRPPFSPLSLTVFLSASRTATRVESGGTSQMRGRVCTYGAAGPSNGKTGSLALEQNKREIQRLKKQVSVLVKVLHLNSGDLGALSTLARSPTSPSPTFSSDTPFPTSFRFLPDSPRDASAPASTTADDPLLELLAAATTASNSPVGSPPPPAGPTLPYHSSDSRSLGSGKAPRHPPLIAASSAFQPVAAPSSHTPSAPSTSASSSAATSLGRLAAFGDIPSPPQHVPAFQAWKSRFLLDDADPNRRKRRAGSAPIL